MQLIGRGDDFVAGVMKIGMFLAFDGEIAKVEVYGRNILR